jgi:hypothetical protein
MKPPEYAPSTSDHVSTREELLEVLELLAGFKEPQDTELAQTRDLLCREADETVFPAELLDEVTSEERLLMEIEPFNSLLVRKAERIN